MIVAYKSEAQKNEFEDLLLKSQTFLTEDSKKQPSYYCNREGVKFETDVCEAMKRTSKGSVFENSIELISGRKFPDIVANKFFGVEVKTSSKGSPWKCVGNSILETSRIESVERIYMFFGKIMPPPEFRFRKYEDCLCEIAVTHSPRYMIDMNIADDETIFNKIGISYDDLRNLDKPVQPIMEYYRRIAGDDCDLWWLDTGDENVSAKNVIIRFWSSLSREEKDNLRCQILSLFPEVIREGRAGDDKYNKASAWLMIQKNIVCPSFRDIFTGGRRVSITVGGVTHSNIPNIFKNHIQGKLRRILKCVEELSMEEIDRYWQVDASLINRKDEWVRRFVNLSSPWLAETSLNIANIIHAELGEEYDHILNAQR